MVERHLFLVLWSTLVATAIGLPAGHRRRSPPACRPSVACGREHRADHSEPCAPRVPAAASIHRRHRTAHRDRRVDFYALLPIVRSTAAGLRSIDPAVIDAGVAMGMTPRQLLWLVELPLALPSIVAGIRIATIVGIGTATIAAAIGAGGLGEYIFRGLSMVDSTVILAGAIPAAAAGARRGWRSDLGRTAAVARPPATVAAPRRSPRGCALLVVLVDRARLDPRGRCHRHRLEELHRAGGARRAAGADA